MKVKIENIGRKKRALYIDGRLAYMARNIEELEAQVRITKLLIDMEETGVRGTL